MNLANAKLLCKFKGGSHSYGLSTPTSDVDWRGVYANTDISSIVGLNSGRDDCRVTQTDTEDSSYTELRAFLRLLRDGNTQALETVYNTEWEFITPQFQNIITNRTMLVSSKKLIKVLKGYAQGELRLANGERTGKLGGKRRACIDNHGFSEKNFVQLFRLLWAGEWFYRTGQFPVDVSYHDTEFTRFLLHVKTCPRDWRKDTLNKIAADLQFKLETTYAKTEVNFVFHEDIANQLCLKIYGPLLVGKAGENVFLLNPSS